MKDDTTLGRQESLAKEKRMVSAVLSLVSWLSCLDKLNMLSNMLCCFTLFSFHSVRLHPASFSWETPGAGQVSPSCLLRAAPANRSLSSVVVGKVRMQWFLSKTSVDLHAVL